MRFLKIRISYRVELTDAEWEFLERKYGLYNGDAVKLFDLLQKQGCYNVDWNGHFGKALYYTCGIENKAKARAAVISVPIIQ